MIIKILVACTFTSLHISYFITATSLAVDLVLCLLFLRNIIQYVIIIIHECILIVWLCFLLYVNCRLTFRSLLYLKRNMTHLKNHSKIPKVYFL